MENEVRIEEVSLRENLCKRCGKCCFYIHNKVIKRCRLLENLPDGKTRCKRYSTRRMTIISRNPNIIHCINRDRSPFDYPDCPYNTNKPIHPIYIAMSKAKESIKDVQ